MRRCENWNLEVLRRGHVFPFRGTMLVVFSASLVLAQSARAQEQQEEAGEEAREEVREAAGEAREEGREAAGEAREEGREAARETGEAASEMKEELKEKAEEAGVEVKDRTESRPEPPGGTLFGDGRAEGATPTIAAGAGAGSQLAYAEKGVIEIGGRLVLDVRDELIDFEVGPSLGWFIFNRFQLSLIPFLGVTHVEDDTVVRGGAIFEPSYHLPLWDWVYASAALGLGLTYEEGPGVEFLFRPVLGTDIMVGRSGILKPSFFLDVGLDDGTVGGGFLASFTVML